LSYDPKKVIEPPFIAFLSPEKEQEVFLASAEPMEAQRKVYYTPIIDQNPPSILFHHPETLSEEFNKKLNTYDPFKDSEPAANGPKVHLSLITPIQGYIPSNRIGPTVFSLNILWGLHNSVHGLEIGGLGNSLKGDMQGVQIGGIFNTVKDKSTGTQIAGIANIANGFSGFQAGGILNISNDSTSGLQIAGISNQSSQGGTLMQIGGIGNTSSGPVIGQIGGIYNFAEEVSGIQIAGIVNKARKVKGIQIGLVNIADSLDGVAIGLFSLVKDGYQSIEFSAEESILANLNFRLGTRHFYNVFSIGSRIHDETWSLGIGVGTSLALGHNHYLQLEAVAKHINENELWTSKLNLLNQFRPTVDLQLSGKIRLAFGPSYNVAVSHRFDEETGTFGTQIKKHSFFNKTYTRHRDHPLNVKMWIGFHAGVRYDIK
jgi:hypothetical protein